MQFLRFLDVERVEAGNFAIENLLWWQVFVKNKLVLPSADIFTSLQSKLLANGEPELFFPRDKVLLNTASK